MRYAMQTPPPPPPSGGGETPGGGGESGFSPDEVARFKMYFFVATGGGPGLVLQQAAEGEADEPLQLHVRGFESLLRLLVPGPAPLLLPRPAPPLQSQHLWAGVGPAPQHTPHHKLTL